MRYVIQLATVEDQEHFLMNLEDGEGMAGVRPDIQEATTNRNEAMIFKSYLHAKVVIEYVMQDIERRNESTEADHVFDHASVQEVFEEQEGNPLPEDY